MQITQEQYEAGLDFKSELSESFSMQIEQHILLDAIVIDAAKAYVRVAQLRECDPHIHEIGYVSDMQRDVAYHCFDDVSAYRAFLTQMISDHVRDVF